MIIVIANFVAQWDTGITVKLLAVVLGSLAATLGLVELVIKRFDMLRRLFGMKNRSREMASTETG